MFIGYRNGNLHFATTKDIRVRILAVIAWLLRVTIHINGVPFGACNGKPDLMMNPAIGWEIGDGEQEQGG